MTRSFVFCSLFFFCTLLPASENGQNELHVAAEVDRLIEEELAEQGIAPTPLANDLDFFRRINLDLAGSIPSTEATTLFGLNPEADKRSQVIDELLQSDDYAINWARYWSDVIFLRATEQRARMAQPAFEKWMQQQFADNHSWNEIVRDLLTATGAVAEEGSTALIFAHQGEPEEIAGEVSRIFLGIQISCANCHDHFTDSWKREQFHQLAAFFPRIALRQEVPGDAKSVVVMSIDDPKGRGQEINLERTLRFLDKDKDNKLAKEEARGLLVKKFDQIVKHFDRDQDSLLSLEELQDARELVSNRPGRGKKEYFMPDLSDPASRGTLMQPAFFLADVDGPKVKSGANDHARRLALAEYVTSPSNVWFSRALVNRMWCELMGEGFYMPVDDIGPERTPEHEEVLEILSNGFRDSGYDIRWLLRTITNTRAYQRQLATAASGHESDLASTTPTRLRADQIYNSLLEVLDVDPETAAKQMRFPGAGTLRSYGLDPGRVAFSMVFGYDPSSPQDEIEGTVPQALFLMNSPQIERLLQARGQTRLARLLSQSPDNEAALKELYLLVLVRNPTPRELKIQKDYIREVGNQQEAFEDIMWALMNSTEFLCKR